MSNLKLPKLDYDTLDGLVKTDKKLAYATHAERGADGAIYLIHHRSVFAIVRRGSVELTRTGWDSQTTAQRQHKALVDSTGIGHGYGIGVRQGTISVVSKLGKFPLPESITFASSGIIDSSND